MLNPTTIHKLFGTELRRERKNLGLTVQMIATACAVSRSYITLIESGRRLPGKKILPKIAASLHLKPAVVLGWYLEDIGQKMQKDLDERVNV